MTSLFNRGCINMLNEQKELIRLSQERVSLERIHTQLKNSGYDGLSGVSKKAMLISLSLISKDYSTVSNEDFTDINISAEDIGEKIKAIGKAILEFIKQLIAKGKEFATKILTGVEGVIKEAEELLDRARDKPNRRVASNELHDGKTIVVNSPGILMADGHFCAADCKSEIEVIKFFQGPWPKYVEEQIKRTNKMIGEYDVESGNSDNFKSNAEFIGNHTTFVASIEKLILPGNKNIKFKYGALGPELVDDTDAKDPPETYEMEVRPSTTIVKTLRDNIDRMRSLTKLFEAEAGVLHSMNELSKAVMALENRRGETIFKGARDDLDTISNMVMALINKLNPNYNSFVRHIAKVATARNAVCRQELDAHG